MSQINASYLSSGSVKVTVNPAESFRRVRALLGDDVRETYVYRIDRKNNPDGTFVLFLLALDAKPNKSPTYVYMGVLHPVLGTLRLTAKSAFPEHATRVQVARAALPRMFKGQIDDLKEQGWSGVIRVLNKLQPAW